MNIGIGIISGIVILGVLAIAHEFGHFIVAKLFHIPVEEFGIGIGPVIYQHKAQDGMVFKLSAIPFLGYNKLKGMNDHIDAPDGFFNQPFWPKFLTILAGPVMNILITILIIAVVFSTMGNPAVPSTTIASVVDGSPAEIAGILPGDKILKIDDIEITSWGKINGIVQQNKDKPMLITVERKGEVLQLNVAPRYDTNIEKWAIGITAKGEVYSLPVAIIRSTTFSFTLLGKMFAVLPQLFSKAGLSSLIGPIGIVSMATEASAGGFAQLLLFASYISLALAFTNLLPIPALDGGWLVAFLAEAVTKKKLINQSVLKIETIALFLLLALMVMVSINDVLRFLVR